MTLIQMEYFAAAAQELNFTRAAAKLHITQQSLSASIAALENELGCRLFIRSVPLVLTYAGNEFLKYSNDILRRLDVLRRDFSDISADRRGTLRVGIAATRAHAIMPDIIARFRRSHPGIQLVIKEDTNAGLRQDILSGDIDIAIANFEACGDGIALRDFYWEDVILLASDELLEQCFGGDKARVVAELERGEFAALGSCPFVLGNPEDIAGKIGYSVLDANSIRPVTAVTADNVELLLSLCLKGIGLCFCPVVLAKAALSGTQYQSLHKFHLGGAGRYQIRFAYRQEEHVWSVTAAFMDAAAEAVHGSKI